MSYYTTSSGIDVFSLLKNGNFQLSSTERLAVQDRFRNWYVVYNIYRDLLAIYNTKPNREEIIKGLFNLLKSFRDPRIDKSIKTTINRNLFTAVYRDTENYTANQYDNLVEVIASKVFYTLSKPLKKDKISFTKTLVDAYVVNKNIELVEAYVPSIFSSKQEFVSLIYELGHTSARMFNISSNAIAAFATQKDKENLYNKIKHIMLNRKVSYNSAPIIAAALKSQWIVDKLKVDFDQEMNDRLVLYLHKIGYKNLENTDFLICKNLLKINPTMIEEMQKAYINCILSRGTGFVRTNKVKIVKFLTTIPGTNPKQVYLQINKSNRKWDPSFLFKKFPELKKLAILA